MSTFLFIRHGSTDHVKWILSGRMTGVLLNECGRRQVSELTSRMSQVKVDMVCSSPLERALETAMPIAAAAKLQTVVSPEINEIDYGRWTGRSFPELERDPQWREFNERRAFASIPGGETMPMVEARIKSFLNRVSVSAGAKTIAVVTHADIIRTALLIASNRSLSEIHSFTVEPASVSAIEYGHTRSKVLFVNNLGELQVPEPSIETETTESELWTPVFTAQ